MHALSAFAACSSLYPLMVSRVRSRVEQLDGIVGPKGSAPTTIMCKCPVCKIDLEADREKMILITTQSKIPA